MEHEYNFNKKKSFFYSSVFFFSFSYKKFHAERDGSIERCAPHLRLNMLNK